MPGTQNIALYDAFHRSGDGIAHYLIRHESGATMLANGFARASGEVAAAFTVPGPGASNASTGILDGMTDCVPVLLVVGGYDKSLVKRDRTKMFHGLSQEKFFAPICRYFGRPESADDVPRVVEEAFQAMFAGRPGPAVIELPPDVAAEATNKFRKPPEFVPRLTDVPVVRNEILNAAARIRKMRRPVLIVGVDVVAGGAVEEVRQLASILRAPVLHGRLGKGIIPDDHPLSAGFTRTRRSHDLLRQADGAIAIGTRFTQIDTRDWTLPVPKNLVQIDRDRKELGREYPAAAKVCGSLAPVIRSMIDELNWMAPEIESDWPAVMNGVRWFRRTLPDIPVLSHIQQVLPRNGLISVDITAPGYNCFDRFDVYAPRSMIYPCHSVTLGFAFPAAIGAKIACPDRPVVSLSGDGGFLMGCYELATAVEHKVGVVAVVVNDHCLSAIKGSQRQAFDGRTIDVDMRSPDFAALARSFGAEGITSRSLDELPSLIEQGLARTGPTVIEVPMQDRIDEMIGVIPWLNGE